MSGRHSDTTRGPELVERHNNAAKRPTSGSFARPRALTAYAASESFTNLERIIYLSRLNAPFSPRHANDMVAENCSLVFGLSKNGNRISLGIFANINMKNWFIVYFSKFKGF